MEIKQAEYESNMQSNANQVCELNLQLLQKDADIEGLRHELESGHLEDRREQNPPTMQQQMAEQGAEVAGDLGDFNDGTVLYIDPNDPQAAALLQQAGLTITEDGTVIGRLDEAAVQQDDQVEQDQGQQQQQVQNSQLEENDKISSMNNDLDTQIMDKMTVNEGSVKKMKLSDYKNLNRQPLPIQNPDVTQEELSTPLKLPDFSLPEP